MKTAVVIAALLVSSSATANIYKCKGPSGATVYREVPCETTESQVNHQIAAPQPSPTPSRQPAPAKGKSDSSSATGKATAAATPADDIDSRMCEGFRRRYEEAQKTSCIQGIQGGTGKVVCMPEVNRTAFIANLKELVEQNCR